VAVEAVFGFAARSSCSPSRPELPAAVRGGAATSQTFTSPASYAAWPGATGYIAARWAMRGFTEALRAALRATGVGVTRGLP